MTTPHVNWLSAHRHWFLFAATVLTGLSAAGVGIVGVFATVSTLLTGGSLVVTAGGFLLGTLLLGGLSAVFGLAFLWTLARMASSAASDVSFPTNRRAADAFHRLESLLPPLAALGLGDRLEPSVEDRRAALTERYVAGELSETQLEAELAALLGEDTAEVGPEPVDVDALSPPRADTDARREARTDTDAETET